VDTRPLSFLISHFPFLISRFNFNFNFSANACVKWQSVNVTGQSVNQSKSWRVKSFPVKSDRPARRYTIGWSLPHFIPISAARRARLQTRNVGRSETRPYHIFRDETRFAVTNRAAHSRAAADARRRSGTTFSGLGIEDWGQRRLSDQIAALSLLFLFSNAPSSV
jgi:hypothetical protein